MDYAVALRTISELAPSRVVIFVGAGLCVDLGYPTWPRFIEMLVPFVEDRFPPHAAVMRHRLQAGDLIHAADPVFEREISASDRARVFKNAFPHPSDLKRRHRLLGNLPVAAFVTTNFDEMIEAAIQHKREADPRNKLPAVYKPERHAVVFSGSDRFRRFNSELGLYRDDYHLRHETTALVLKIHNDINDPERMVLHSKSFAELPSVDGYQIFYETIFRHYSVIFVGFGGADPNLLDIVAREVAGYAGYSSVESYILLPHGVAAPSAILSSPHLHAVHYSPDNNHRQLEEFLEAINGRWTSTTVQQRIAAASSYEDAEPDVARDGISIFDLMIPAFRDNVDKTIVEALKTFMVQTGVAVAGTNPRSVANQVAQKFGLSVEHSKRLVEDHAHVLQSEPRITKDAAEDFVTTLARGVRRRAHAFDTDFTPDLEALKSPVRTTLESAMKAYGANLALSVLQSERPSRLQLAETVRNTIRAGRWSGIGEQEREVLSIAIADLFMEPSSDEATIISRLATTAVAFGIIQAFPETNLSDVVLPTKVYLDATCVLPAVAHVPPRSTALLTLITELRSLRRPVLFLDGFMEEVKGHFGNAKLTITQKNILTIGDLHTYLATSGEVEEFENVFLLALSKLQCDPSESAHDSLMLHFSPDSFPQLIERLGARVVHADVDPNQVAALKTVILSEKKQWYGRTLAKRELLARHEAVQLLLMQKELSSGEKPWFATDDNQLRRIVRGKDELDRLTLLPIAGIRSIVSAMSNASEYSSLYPRLLWNPDWGDRADALVTKALRELFDKIDPGVKLPLAEARDLAVKELLNRDNEASDASPVYESVYSFLGRAIIQAKDMQAQDQTKRRG